MRERDHPPPPGTCIGRVDACSEATATASVVEAAGDRFPVLLVRRGGRVFAYVNRCPHMGLPLDDLHDAILSVDRERLVCSAHKASFAVETGRAVRGLPPDCALQPIAVRVTASGAIVVDTAGS